MLRKRSESNQKDQRMSQSTVPGSGSESIPQSEIPGKRNKNSSFFSVGLNPKGFPDSDSVRSPKSPLDFRVFSNFGSPFRSPLSPSNGNRKTWGSNKVGLSIIDSLNNDSDVLRSSSDGKTILFGPQMRSRSNKTPKTETNVDDSFEVAKSLPKNYVIKESPLSKGISGVVFEIGDDPFDDVGRFRSCSLDSCRSILSVPGLANNRADLGVPNSIPEPPECVFASDFELDEDYTCVITHGPNPKTTHIYGDCIVKCDGDVLSRSSDDERKKISITNAFLSLCYSCNKKLEEGKDIYIYRGEKSFCSMECRSREILIDEAMEKTAEMEISSTDDKLFEGSMFVAS